MLDDIGYATPAISSRTVGIRRMVVYKGKSQNSNNCQRPNGTWKLILSMMVSMMSHHGRIALCIASYIRRKHTDTMSHVSGVMLVQDEF